MNDVAMQLRLLAACVIAQEAGNLVRSRFLDRDEALELNFKGPQDYLTETDAEVEKLIALRLAQAFPDDGFFGEEGGGTYGSSVWIVDPIDGTAEFARGVAHFCVSIAFVHEGRTQIGVIFDPMAGELFAARRGCGTTLNGRPIRVSSIDDTRRSVVELGWSPRIPFARYLRVATRLNELGVGLKRCGSGALGLAYVAAGRQDAYCELHINAWDAAAGVLLIEEAGGWINDFLTAECLIKGNRVIGCTPALREAMVSAMDA
jgi:myo-inositol-1(or 4)-monophosphatase